MFPLPQFLQDLPYTHPTKSLSLNKRNKQQKDIKNVKKIKSSQKYIEFILCLPTKPWHVACVGVWLINPVMLHWAKLTFPLTEVITTANNFKKRERGVHIVPGMEDVASPFLSVCCTDPPICLAQF